MRILVVTQYFWPEDFRINDLVIGLKERGHDVTVLTGIPNYPSGRIFQGYSFLGPMRESYHGIRVFRVPLIPRGSGTGPRLLLNYISFVLFGSLLGPLHVRGKYDLIFVYEPSPVTVAIPAVVLKKLKQVPLVLWVLDLWPESLHDAGGIRSPLILEATRILVRFLYHNSDLILAQSEAFIPRIEKIGVDLDRIRYFPSWAELVYAPGQAEEDGAQKVSLPNGFRVMFAGNIGNAQGFDIILAAAERLKGYPDIHWLILGDGRMRNWVAQEIENRRLADTVHLLGRHPVEDMPWFFSMADAMLVTLKKKDIFSLTIPGKVQSYLESGKPIIAALDGEGARVIQEAGAGISCPAGDPEALANAVLTMYKMTESERKKMGLSGRAYYESHFERGMLLDRLNTWLEELKMPVSQRE